MSAWTTAISLRPPSDLPIWSDPFVRDMVHSPQPAFHAKATTEGCSRREVMERRAFPSGPLVLRSSAWLTPYHALCKTCSTTHGNQHNAWPSM